MDFNAQIIDQHVLGLINSSNEEIKIYFEETKKSQQQQKSLAFTALCVSKMIDIPMIEALDCLTDGGNDQGIDAIYVGEPEGHSFRVMIFQSKYYEKLDAEKNFPENDVRKSIELLSRLVDPKSELKAHSKLKSFLEEIRSLVAEAYIPEVHFIFCSNGKKWVKDVDERIDEITEKYNNQVSFCYINHQDLISFLMKKKSVDDTFQLVGRSFVEDMNYRRVLIGKVHVSEIARIFQNHGDLLLEKNIRRYLGLSSNRVNTAIQDTLIKPSKRENFYFLNNGITIVCEHFTHDALKTENHAVRLKGLQIINGGQTCKTIQKTLDEHHGEYTNCFVLVRIYEIAKDDEGFMNEITYATNSQNPVDLHDLKSNDEYQSKMEESLKQLGYTYKRKKDDASTSGQIIPSTVLAEAVLAVWRRKPHQAKFMRKEHFGKLYSEIFRSLNGSQAVLAVLIFRFVDNKRKRNTDMIEEYPFIPYASYYIAMIMGDILLEDKELKISSVNHHNFRELHHHLQEKQETYYKQSLEKIKEALKLLYVSPPSLQRLSATFRQGRLLEQSNTLLSLFSEE